MIIKKNFCEILNKRTFIEKYKAQVDERLIKSDEYIWWNYLINNANCNKKEIIKLFSPKVIFVLDESSHIGS